MRHADLALSDLAKGRDNNFNLLRLIAASAVLVSHSFTLATGDASREPLTERLGNNLGAFSVDVFFITSGFLVTASLLNRRSTIEFIWARVLRIYPAMLLMVLLTTLVLGPLLTTLPLAEYLAHPETLRFAAKNATLVGGVAYDLPGVFVDAPYGRTVNGSLWTMPIEVRMYIVLTLLWLLLKPTAEKRPAAMGRMVVALAAGALLLHFYQHVVLGVDKHTTRLFLMFFTGAAYYEFRERVPLSNGLFFGGLAALLLASLDRAWFFPVYTLSIGYLVLWLAYVPGGAIRGFNRLGDYSYGVYIYAFPIQQLTVTLLPGISIGATIAVAGAATLACGALSWHLLEKHALKLKEGAVAASRRAVGQDAAGKAVPGG